MSRKELKILDSATLYCVSGFRRNYNNRLLKLAPVYFFHESGKKGKTNRVESGVDSRYSAKIKKGLTL
jgi:hypothetical protein